MGWGEKRGNISRSGGAAEGKGGPGLPHISHPGAALLGPSSARGVRHIAVLPVNHRVGSALRGGGLEVGASPITHSLTLGNTPEPQFPSGELVSPLSFAHQSLPARQTPLWLCRCSIAPSTPPNISTHPKGPSTTHGVQP